MADPERDATAITDARVGWSVVGLTTTLWLTHLVGMAVLTERSCAGGGVAVLHLFTLGLLVPTLWLTWLAWQRRRGGEGQRFLGAFAVWVGAINAFAIVAEWIPVFLLDACP